MSLWYRTQPFSADHESRRLERWEYRRAVDPVTFDVEIEIGKHLDVAALKGTDLEEVRSYGAFLAETASRIYAETSTLERCSNCPICRSRMDDGAEVVLKVYGVPYVRCSTCGHVFVEDRPKREVLGAIFSDSDEHSSLYVDEAALEVRMAQIIAPKLDWCLGVAQRRSRPTLRRVIDVGAGAGHFLAGASRRGLEVEGFETSKASRAFAHKAFGLELRADDYLTARVEPADLVTFWGLLEYVENPRAFLEAARRSLKPNGLLIVEVPRVDALGTRVQALEGALVARHMDPTSHVNAFSDESLCTALVEEGFAPVAAWYFGLDAWEAAIQTALRAGGNESLLSILLEFVPAVQSAADFGRQCDDIVVAAVPIP